MNIDFGLKLWSSNNDMLVDAVDMIDDDKFQYIELTPVPGTDIKAFKDLDVPYIIHITTERWGFNISDKSSASISRGLLNDSIRWADELDAKYMIMHPGFEEIDVAMSFLAKIDDDRILLENMPMLGLNGEMMVGYSPSQINQLKGKLGFCLDLNHAMKAAGSLSVPYQEFMTEFLTLKPKVFHIADGHMAKPEDEHLHIGDGDYDIKHLMDILPNDAYLTLETPRASFSDDLDNLMKLKLLLQRGGQS